MRQSRSLGFQSLIREVRQLRRLRHLAQPQALFDFLEQTKPQGHTDSGQRLQRLIRSSEYPEAVEEEERFGSQKASLRNARGTSNVQQVLGDVGNHAMDQLGINWSLSSSYYEDSYWLALSAKRKLLLQVPVTFPLPAGLS